MRTAGIVCAGFVVLFGLSRAMLAAVPLVAPEVVSRRSWEFEAFYLGFDVCAAMVAGAVTSYLGRGGVSREFASFLFMFLFMGMFLVEDNSLVWFTLARLPLLPAFALVGGMAQRRARMG